MMGLMTRLSISALLLCPIVVCACGDDGGPTPIDAALPDAAMSDANLDCSAPTVADGMPCQVDGQTCGGPCNDPCSFCNVLVCDNGTWGRIEVVPAPCFACGPDEQCIQSSHYCHLEHPDVGGQPDVYQCQDTPQACASDPSCTCLATEIVYDACTGDPGSVTVETSGG